MVATNRRPPHRRLDRVPVDQVILARQANPDGPGRILLTLILGVFFIIGWLTGRSVMLAVDCFNSARIGYWRGKGLTADQVRERLTAAKPVPPG